MEYATFPALAGAYQASATPLPPDTEAPTVAMTGPADGATVAGSVAVSANASDNVVVAGVQFKLNGTNLGAEDTAAPYTINWDSTTVTNGSYQLTAVARDAANNTATSALVNVTVNNVPDTTPPTVTSVGPQSGAVDIAGGAVVTAVFSEAMDPATVNGTTFELRDSGSNLVAATVSYDAGTQTATLTPSSPLANSSAYTALVRGGASDPRVKDVAGNALAADYSWGFTTVAPSPYVSIWDEVATPTIASENDANPVEVGVKFRSDVAGEIAGLRFYKGPNNTGTHVGNLWNSTGTLLASATFVNETASGWQEVLFPAPVAIAANTTYVASYHTTVGYYSLDENYFTSSGVDNPPLRALADGEDGNNGVYTYSATSVFPTSSYSAGNYWVDVLFAVAPPPDTTPPTVSITTPLNGATVAGTTEVTATAADNVGVAGVQFQVDGMNVGAEDTVAPYTVSWNSTTVADGPHQVTAVARDTAGNSTTSPAVNVTVDNGTVPVTLSYFKTTREGDMVRFVWQTATETANAGFNLLGQTTSGIVPLNEELLPSKVIDAVEPTDYDIELSTDAALFFLEEVGIDGFASRKGPFELGRSYGSRVVQDAVDPSVGSNRLYLPLVIR